MKRTESRTLSMSRRYKSAEKQGLISEANQSGLRDQVKIMIGGAPVTQEFADEIGADYYGPDATSGKEYAREAC